MGHTSPRAASQAHAGCGGSIGVAHSARQERGAASKAQDMSCGQSNGGVVLAFNNNKAQAPWRNHTICIALALPPLALFDHMPRTQVVCIEEIDLNPKDKKAAQESMALLEKNAGDIAVRY